MPNWTLLILRIFFLLFAGAVGIYVIMKQPNLASSAVAQYAAFFVVMGIAAAIILADMAFRRKNIDTVSAVYFGLIVGLFLTYVTGLALDPFLDLLAFPTGTGEPAAWTKAVKFVVGMVLCYLCISVLLQTRNDFRFIIPYVEFAREVKGLRPHILDTSVIIDGRIADVVEARIFETQLIMPRFVLTELQSIADSSDRLRRSRGRRGLDILNRLRAIPDVDFQVYDRELPEFAGQPVDMKLVLLAKHLEGKIVTNDYNLNKVARLQGVGVVNLNDLANALKPVFLPGEHLRVAVVKAGEELGQGVGYLDDGTMVVVEAGRDHVGQTVDIGVTSVLQTSAGRMIFGKFEKVVVAGKQ
ncbi:MAG: PIN domain-containing protein [Planctomycetia bacterium]|nr:PIN domain-containing protein [Planctomycetia bacterium]